VVQLYFLSVCLHVSGITQKLWIDFLEVVGRGALWVTENN